MDYISYYQSPLGKMLLACDEIGLIGIWFEGAKYYAYHLSEEVMEEPNHPTLRKARAWLDAYFSGQLSEQLPVFAYRGTVFQKQVWTVLKTVPYGQTITYGQLAEAVSERFGRFRLSARAVGGAVGRNPLSIMVPCHRVLGKNGCLTGYAGGLDRKLSLLTLEKSDWGRI